MIKRQYDQKASGDLHQDLLDDGGVCDGQPWRGHVVEPVDFAIQPVSLHVKLREVDLHITLSNFLSKTIPFCNWSERYSKTFVLMIHITSIEI